MKDKTLFGNQTVRFFIFMAIFVACWLLGRYFKIDLDYFQSFLSSYPLILSAVIYVILYVGITTFVWFGPKDVFRVLGAIILGPYLSTLFVSISELLNLCIMFQLSRKLGRDYVEQKFRVKSRDIDKASKGMGFIGVLAIRLNPMIPFRIMDLAYGVTQISLKKYLSISLLASPFRIFWLQFILFSMSHVILKERESILEIIPEMMEFFTANPMILNYSWFYFLVVILLSLLAIVIKIIKGYRNKNV